MHKIYLVGGAVRDEQLGRAVKDRDYVVVGATPQELLAAGYKQVGADFPVFLHPVTREEYALARTERKTGPGYAGFTVHASPDVTLEEDLARRDLTINAIACDADGQLVDPFNGCQDIRDRVLRHVHSESFVEDPVRVLRLARFAARYTDFAIAPETMKLLREMVANGELSHLVPERVWQELAKGLMEDKPSRMIDVLHDCGALNVLLPELAALEKVEQPFPHHPELWVLLHTKMVLDQAARINAPLEVRFAAMVHDLGKGLTPKDQWPSHHDHDQLGVPLVEAVSARLKVPGPCRDVAVMVCREHTRIHGAKVLTPGRMLQVFMRTDALRRPERFKLALDACQCDARGRRGLENRDYPQSQLMMAALAAARAVPAAEVVRLCRDKSRIPEKLLEARILAIKATLKSEKTPNE